MDSSRQAVVRHINEAFDRVKRASDLLFTEYTVLDTPVPQLYHYTTAEGLVGILQSGCIYASHVSFLNDTSEATHALEFGKELLKECAVGKIQPEEMHGLSGEQLALYGSPLFEKTNQLWQEDAYVTSFCEDGDLLSQWRGYAMGGFAILFARLTGAAPVTGERFPDRDLLVKSPVIWKTTINKVVYQDDEKKRAILSILAAGCKATEKASDDAKVQSNVALLTSLLLQMWVHTAKHSSFHHEREWRIISFKDTKAGALRVDKGFQARLVAGQLVPAIRLMPATGQQLPIVGVKCGPNAGTDLTEKAVRLLLSSHGYPTDQVTTSTIPFRSRY